jgi:hypothetical protein
MTVTVNAEPVPMFVTSPKTGQIADDSTGKLKRSRGTIAHDKHGDDAQEYNGRPKRGQTGSVS